MKRLFLKGYFSQFICNIFAICVQHYKGEDTKTVMELQAHTLKGVAANLEFIELYKACTKMVDHLREKRTDTIDENFAAVETEYMKLINVLKEL